MKKWMYLAAAGVGYVLGSRAGRERYQQISTQASRLWKNPKVQQTKEQATDLVKDKAPEIKRSVTDATSKAADAATSKVRSGDTAADAITSEPPTPLVPPVSTDLPPIPTDLPPTEGLRAEDLDPSEPARPSDSTAITADETVPTSPSVAGTSTGGAHRDLGPTT